MKNLPPFCRQCFPMRLLGFICLVFSALRAEDVPAGGEPRSLLHPVELLFGEVEGAGAGASLGFRVEGGVPQVDFVGTFPGTRWVWADGWVDLPRIRMMLDVSGDLVFPAENGEALIRLEADPQAPKIRIGDEIALTTVNGENPYVTSKQLNSLLKTSLGQPAMQSMSSGSGYYSTEIGYGSYATGDYSFAGGYYSSAEAEHSFAFGYYAQSTGGEAIAIGEFALASGPDAIALGDHAAATADDTFAVGQDALADEEDAIAMGNGSHAAGEGAIAIGEDADAHGDNSVAIGEDAESDGDNSVAIGQDAESDGEDSIAIGYYTSANARGQIAIGVANVRQGDDDDDEFNDDDDLLIVGNGYRGDIYDEEYDYYYYDTYRSNALVVRRNGDLALAGKAEFRGGLRVAPAGDLPMGDFTAGRNPAELDAGLRYTED